MFVNSIKNKIEQKKKKNKKQYASCDAGTEINKIKHKTFTEKL